jgi:hypothetical protein
MLSSPKKVAHTDVRRNPSFNRKIEGYTIPYITEAGMGSAFCEDAELIPGMSLIQLPKAGYLLKVYLSVETMINGRWKWWEEVFYNRARFVSTKEIEFPWLDFKAPHPEATQRLHNVLEYIAPEWRSNSEERWKAIEYLLDYILWGFGHPLAAEIPLDHWSEEGRTFDWVYQTLELGFFAMFPADYFGELIELFCRLDEEQGLPRKFLTPMSFHQARNLASQLFPNNDEVDYTTELFIDPQTTTGTMLLAASNYTTRLTGMNTSSLLSKAAIANAYLYSPWVLFPFPQTVVAPEQENWSFVVGRTLAALREKNIPIEYFGDTEPVASSWQFLPIQQRQRRVYVEPELEVLPTQKMGYELLPTTPVDVAMQAEAPLPGYDYPQIAAGIETPIAIPENHSIALPPSQDP